MLAVAGLVGRAAVQTTKTFSFPPSTHSGRRSINEKRGSEPAELIYLWISYGFWIITILLPGGSIGNYSKSCLWFSTCPLTTIINMQSTQGHSQGKTHKMKLFLFLCPPPPRPFHCSPAPPCPVPQLLHYLRDTDWSFFLAGFLLNWVTLRPSEFYAPVWFATPKMFVSLPGHIKIFKSCLSCWQDDEWKAFSLNCSLKLF